MATLESLITRTRMELADVKRPFYEVQSSTGISRIELQVEHVESLFVYPKDDPEALIDPETYTLDKAAGRVFFDDPPEYGTTLVFEGESSNLFSDEEMQVFVESAFSKHTNNRNPGMSIRNLPAMEDHLVAILAKIEALWVLLTSAAYDINIHAPEGMFVPRVQRYQQLRELLQMTEAQYKELCNALGVGLYTVEMLTLRRVSRATGRYVPVYLDREVDDTRPPQRVFPGIGSQGAEVAEQTVPATDIQVYQGRSFREEFEIETEDGPANIGPNDEFSVHLFRDAYSVGLERYVLPEFTVEANDAENYVVVEMAGEGTAKLESTGSYVWELRWTPEGGEEQPVTSGRVLVESALPIKGVHVRTAHGG